MIPTLGGGYFAESGALAMDLSRDWHSDGTFRFFALYSMVIEELC